MRLYSLKEIELNFKCLLGESIRMLSLQCDVYCIHVELWNISGSDKFHSDSCFKKQDLGRV